jgi:mRNA-degrading endonuclease toxin of MazEF toxin-antitoxin module
LRTSRYRFGQVVWASIHDGFHSTKVRPALIIDKDDEYEATGEIEVIPFSTGQPRPLLEWHVEIRPENLIGNCSKLPKQCWAKCDWGHYIKIERIRSTICQLPDDLLDSIEDAYGRFVDSELE